MPLPILTETAYNNTFDYTLNLETNRTSGVAPLGVSFDLTNSVFADTDENGDSDQIMLAEFMWDFGDNGTANGTGTDDEYNIGKGYCPSHVYRNAGTYLVTCRAYFRNIGDETNDNGTPCKVVQTTITVSDDYSAFTDYYISADGSDDTGDGSESNPFATPAYAMENFTATNTRFFLRNGDTFTKSADLNISSIDGPVIITSYEDSENPSSVKPVIYDDRNDAQTGNILGLIDCDDFRVYDIKLQAAGQPLATRDDGDYARGIAMQVASPCTNTLILDVDIQGTGSSAYKIEGTNNVVQDCTLVDGGSYGVYMDVGTGCAFIGMEIQDFAYDNPEYTMRLSTVIKKNYVAYCDLRGDYTKNTFQIRGDDSSYNYVYKNQMDRATGINETNDDEYEILHHNTWDSNIIIARDYSDASYPDQEYNQIGFEIGTRTCMVRNNIIYGFEYGFLTNEHPDVGSPIKVWLYNNTVIGNMENSQFANIYYQTRNISIKNNIFYNLYSTSSSYNDRWLAIGSQDADYSPSWDQIVSNYNVFIGAAWSSSDLQTLIGVPYISGDPTFAEWQDDYGQDNNSSFSDALLNTTMDMSDVTGSLNDGFATLGEGSPAIGSAEARYLISRFDFNGNERASNDIGAICTEVK